MNTQVNNKLIADFLGWTLNSIGVYGYYRQFDKLLYNPLTGNDKSYDPDHLAFHVSWEWIMLAVDKIESLGFDTHIFHDEDGQQCQVWNGVASYTRNSEDMIIPNIPVPAEVTKLEATYKAVINFIQWYNTNKGTLHPQPAKVSKKHSDHKLRAAYAAGLNGTDFDEWKRKFENMYE